MCYRLRMSETVGLRELRQRASELVRRVEDGERLTVTVNGRAAAELVPVRDRRWRHYSQVRHVLAGAGAPGLLDDVAEWSDRPADPFARNR